MDNIFIHKTAIIYAGVKIGEGTYIGPNCVIGAPPEHRDYWDKDYKSVVIGKNCRITSGVTIDSGTTQDTTIGNNVTILRHAHVGHDALLEDECEVSANAIVGGHVHMKYASVLGMGAITRQHLTIGQCSMAAMGAVVVTSIPDFQIFAGVPAKFLKQNTKRMEKYGFRY